MYHYIQTYSMHLTTTYMPIMPCQNNNDQTILYISLSVILEDPLILKTIDTRVLYWTVLTFIDAIWSAKYL